MFCKLCEGKIGWNTLIHYIFNLKKAILVTLVGIFFQFRFIDILFKKWLKDNDKIYDPVRENIVKGVVVSQRILECLGMNRLVTLGQLCQYIEEQRPVFERVVLGDEKDNMTTFSLGQCIDSSEEGIKRALEKFTLPGDYHGPYYSHRPELRYDFDWLLNQYAMLGLKKDYQSFSYGDVMEVELKKNVFSSNLIYSRFKGQLHIE